MEQKERRNWRTAKGLSMAGMRPWGQVFKQATEEQLNVRELDDDFTTTEYRPRRVHFSKSDIYYMDHEGKLWDEVSGKQLSSEK